MQNNWPYKIKPDEVIVTEVGDVFINGDGILVMRYQNYLEFELKKAKSATKVCEEILCGKKAPVMIITGEYGNMPIETREYLASKEVAKHRRAAAIVINNLAYRLMAQFIIKTRSKYYPSRIFKNEEEALNWLKEIR